MLRLPPPNQAVAGWHVSPLVDLVAYHLSWLLILVPLALAGDNHPVDYMAFWAIGVSLSFLHRHFTMPYVYLDVQVLRTHASRFLVVPAVLVCAFVGTPFLDVWKMPKAFLHPVDLAVVAGLLLSFFVFLSADRRVAAARERAVLAKDDARAAMLQMTWPSMVLAVVPALFLVVTGFAHLYVDAHVPVAAAAVALCIASLVSTAQAVRSVLRGEPERPEAMRALVPTLVLVGLLALALLWLPLTSSSMWPAWPTKAWRFRPVVGAIATFAVLWNVWHVYMQKFGILRMYAAKSAAPPEKRTPAWVDRLLVFAWVPFLFLYLGPLQRPMVEKHAKPVLTYVLPMIDAVTSVRSIFIVPAGLLVAFSIWKFFSAEFKSGAPSRPRLWMGLSLTGLSAAFLFVNPLKVYIAYGFAHAFEYMVFVWAFQRRRYSTPLPHKPFMAKVLRWPVLWYAALTLLIAGAYFLIDFGQKMGLREPGWKPFGFTPGMWLYAWAIWHSLAHFYFDGFLWKMRMPAVRQSI